MNYVLPDRRSLAVAVTLWFVAGVLGALLFWVVQLIAGGVTIPAFIGQQIVAAGGYPAGAATAIGWAVHSGVSLSYALVFGVLAIAARWVSLGRRLAALFVVAVALGGLTTAIAPPAISITIAMLAGRGWPTELFPLNTERGVPFGNHIAFFVLNWLIQVVGGRVFERRAGVGRTTSPLSATVHLRR